MSGRVRNALGTAIAMAIGVGLYDVLTGRLSVNTAYRSIFMAVFLFVVFLVVPMRKPPSQPD